MGTRPKEFTHFVCGHSLVFSPPPSLPLFLYFSLSLSLFLCLFLPPSLSLSLSLPLSCFFVFPPLSFSLSCFLFLSLSLSLSLSFFFSPTLTLSLPPSFSLMSLFLEGPFSAMAGVPENRPLSSVKRQSAMGHFSNFILMGRFTSWKFIGKQPIKKRVANPPAAHSTQKMPRNPKFIQNLSRRSLFGVPISGTQISQKLVEEFVLKLLFPKTRNKTTYETSYFYFYLLINLRNRSQQTKDTWEDMNKGKI